MDLFTFLTVTATERIVWKKGKREKKSKSSSVH